MVGNPRWIKRWTNLVGSGAGGRCATASGRTRRGFRMTVQLAFEPKIVPQECLDSCCCCKSSPPPTEMLVSPDVSPVGNLTLPQRRHFACSVGLIKLQFAQCHCSTDAIAPMVTPHGYKHFINQHWHQSFLEIVETADWVCHHHLYWQMPDGQETNAVHAHNVSAFHLPQSYYQISKNSNYRPLLTSFCCWSLTKRFNNRVIKRRTFHLINCRPA